MQKYTLVDLSDKTKREEAAKPPADASPRITNLPESSLTQVEIKRKDGERTVIVRTGENSTGRASRPASPGAPKPAKARSS